MLAPFTDVNWNPDRAARRRFALSLVIGFPILASVLAGIAWATTHAWKPFFLWMGAIGFAVGVILWLVPQIARPFYVAWYFVGCCVGLVMGHVLLGAFFYLLLTPLGLVMRAAGRDPLRRRFDRSAPTYWRDAEKTIDLRRYYRQF